MSGSTRSVPSILYTVWHWGFSELHFSKRIHKFCVSNNEWSYVEGSLMWMQLLPDAWQIGIDLRIRLVAAACELSFRLLTKAVENKEASQGLIRACQGWCLNWSADSEPEGGLSSSRLESWVACSRSPSAWVQPQVPFRAGSAVWGLETRGVRFRPSATHCVTPA